MCRINPPPQTNQNLHPCSKTHPSISANADCRVEKTAEIIRLKSKEFMIRAEKLKTFLDEQDRRQQQVAAANDLGSLAIQNKVRVCGH